MTNKDTAPEPDRIPVAPPVRGVEAYDGAKAGVAPPCGRLLSARGVDEAREDIMALVSSALDLGAEEASRGAAVLELELAVAARMVRIAQHLLAFVLASACRAAMEREVEARGLAREQFRLRTDDAGYATLQTTFGPIRFPNFSYRDLSVPVGSVTRSPSRRLLPYHGSCRSSPLCLQWEARLGLQHPFRRAEEMMAFFTRGASTIEDTTISRHMLALSRMIEPEWLYQRPETIRQTIRERATRDKLTGRPLVYVSSDAHALRRYTGDTWALQWKMVNGIRVWCEDAETGQTIHLGGEFTWGDCHEVRARFQALRDDGVLPNDGPEWAEVNAQVVFVSDGSTWLLEHLVPVLVDAIVILDPYHLIDWFSAFTKLVFGAGSKRSRELHARLRQVLFNKRPKTASKDPKRRRGHHKTRGPRVRHAHGRPWARRGRPRTTPSESTTKALLDLLAQVEVSQPEHVAALEALVERLTQNALRIDYSAHLARGLQIGSGAMESMHRTGSQLRLKLPGASWLKDTSQAVLNFRMLELGGRWHEFWAQPDLAQQVAQAFTEQRSQASEEDQQMEAA